MVTKNQEIPVSGNRFVLSLGLFMALLGTASCNSQEKAKAKAQDAQTCQVPKESESPSAKLVSDMGTRQLPQQFSQCSLNNMRCLVHIYVPSEPSGDDSETKVHRLAADYCLPPSDDLADYPYLAKQSGCIRIDRLDIPAPQAEDPLYNCRFPDLRAPLSPHAIATQSESLLQALELTIKSCRAVVQAIRSGSESNEN